MVVPWRGPLESSFDAWLRRRLRSLLQTSDNYALGLDFWLLGPACVLSLHGPARRFQRAKRGRKPPCRSFLLASCLASCSPSLSLSAACALRTATAGGAGLASIGNRPQSSWEGAGSACNNKYPETRRLDPSSIRPVIRIISRRSSRPMPPRRPSSALHAQGLPD